MMMLKVPTRNFALVSYIVTAGLYEFKYQKIKVLYLSFDRHNSKFGIFELLV